MELSYFPGCTAHSTGLEYTMSMNAVFEALGIKLLEIEDWNCCGAAAAHSLNRLLGLALPTRNIAKAQERDLPLVTPCAGCFGALKTAQDALSHDPDKRQELEEIVGFKYNGKLEIKALIDVVMNQIGLETLKSHVKKPLSELKVACYYGCALVRNPKIKEMGDPENPMFLDDLVSCLGGQPMEWSWKTDCCGADLALTHGETVVKLVDKIIGMAKEAGANCVVCHCGLCQINLEMRQSDKGDKLPVFYFTELMGLAMDLEGRKKWWKKHMVNPSPLLKSLNLSE
ncbi:MAG: CoB--CoM heterodisulfide reductase iron-sulfur subunit B family protein [Deltaproteobacteria bacterium]|nr:CoB--CoM heterodisulfide reductase iron-sulfur subunit B family protein [Deltaproteobacteria bacterium]